MTRCDKPPCERLLAEPAHVDAPRPVVRPDGARPPAVPMKVEQPPTAPMIAAERPAVRIVGVQPPAVRTVEVQSAHLWRSTGRRLPAFASWAPEALAQSLARCAWGGRVPAPARRVENRWMSGERARETVGAPVKNRRDPAVSRLLPPPKLLLVGHARDRRACSRPRCALARLLQNGLRPRFRNEGSS